MKPNTKSSESTTPTESTPTESTPTESTPTETTVIVPTALESAHAKLVYIYLEREREATVDALATALGVPKLGLFTVLSTLEAAGYVERNGARTVRFAN